MNHSEQKPLGVGIIGLGMRGLNCLGINLAHMSRETGLKITALCDRNAERTVEARDWLVGEYAQEGVACMPNLYEDGEALINAPEVDLVMITSITDTHRQFALPALKSGKKVYCDKPLAQNVENAVAIVAAEAKAQNPLIMGFTRRYETAWQTAYDLLQEGRIGELMMIQVRDIIPYHRYTTAWWRRRAWSGGALNDKGSHLFDVFNWFTGSRATSVHGFGSRSALQPQIDAPRRCSECDLDCPYRRRPQGDQGLGNLPHFGPSWLAETEEKHMDDVCAYAPGTDIYHNGSVHLNYENGVIASYFYSFFGPKAQDQETLELVGRTGRILLTRHEGIVDVVTERGREHKIIDCRGNTFGGSHFGADQALIRELGRFGRGAPPKVSAQNGLEATRLVMAALQSMDQGGKTVNMKEITDARI